MTQVEAKFTTESGESMLVTGDLQLLLHPEVPALHLRIGNGPWCILRGENIGNLTRWLREEGYKIPKPPQLVCTCPTKSDAKGTDHDPDCYWNDAR